MLFLTSTDFNLNNANLKLEYDAKRLKQMIDLYILICMNSSNDILIYIYVLGLTQLYIDVYDN